MVSATTSTPSIRVVAGVPLLRAGLERAARAASFELLAEGRPDVWLLGPDEAASSGDVEVSVDGDRIRVNLLGVPDEAVWNPLLRLLHHLVDAPGPAASVNGATAR